MLSPEDLLQLKSALKERYVHIYKDAKFKAVLDLHSEYDEYIQSEQANTE